MIFGEKEFYLFFVVILHNLADFIHGFARDNRMEGLISLAKRHISDGDAVTVQGHKRSNAPFDIDKLTAHHLIAVIQCRRKDCLPDYLFQRKLCEAQFVFFLNLRKIGKFFSVSAGNREKYITARNSCSETLICLDIDEFFSAFQLADDVADQSRIQRYFSFFTDNALYFG